VLPNRFGSKISHVSNDNHDLVQPSEAQSEAARAGAPDPPVRSVETA